MTNLEQEIISDIDNIETVTLEAEYNVLSTLVDCYYKQSLIMEYYNGDNINDFSIFQESHFMESKDVAKENIFKRLYRWFKKMILNLSYKIMSAKPDKIINKLKKYSPDDKLMVEGSKYISSSDIVNSFFDHTVNTISLLINKIKLSDTDIETYKRIINEYLPDEEMKNIKKLSNREKIDDYCEYIKVGVLIEKLEKTKDDIEDLKPDIKKMINNLAGSNDNALDFVGDNTELLSTIKNAIQKSVKYYTIMMNQILKMFDVFTGFKVKLITSNNQNAIIKNPNKTIIDLNEELSNTDQENVDELTDEELEASIRYIIGGQDDEEWDNKYKNLSNDVKEQFRQALIMKKVVDNSPNGQKANKALSDAINALNGS